MQIYQVFTGRLKSANVAEHKGEVFELMKSFRWRKLVDLGFTHVYLLGVFDYRGPIVVNEEEGRDISNDNNRRPSVFAIRDHFGVHPDLGTIDDMRELVKVLESQGLEVLVDFIPNQTGLEHGWVNNNPEFYQINEGELKSGFSGDVMMLDLENIRVREEQMKVLKNICDWGVSGVRCDMAHLAPINFWKELIPKIRNYKKDFAFIAEAYSVTVFEWYPITSLIDAGFDAIYDEFLYRNMKYVSENIDGLSGMCDHVNYTRKQKMDRYLVRYLSNHDDGFPMSDELIEGLWVFLKLLNTNLLMFNGMMNGRGKRLSHHVMEVLGEECEEFNLAPGIYRSVNLVINSIKPKVVKVYDDSGIIWVELMVNEGRLDFFVSIADRCVIKKDVKQSLLLKDGLDFNNLRKGDWGII